MVRSKSITGVASLGQGVETAIAQICADALGVNYSNIKVIHGQTDRIDKGMGAFASRVTVMCGEATRLAATKLRAELLEVAAGLMQSNADVLDIVGEQIVRRDFAAGPVLTLAELAREHPAPLSAEATFESAHMVYPYGVHIAAVRDRCRHRRRHHRALCHRLRHRQGGQSKAGGRPDRRRPGAGHRRRAAGGISLRRNGEPLSVTFADYLMPTAREIPELSILVTEDAPSPLNPLGLKGAGEGGANPVGAAIASAIDDALAAPAR